MATDLERLDELLAKQERTVREAFLRYVELVQTEAVTAMVLDRLEAGDVEGARALLERYAAQVGDALPEVQLDVGRETSSELQQLLRGSALAISFDATHPRAAALVRTQRLGLIREFTDRQLETVQQAVERAVGNGLGPADTGRAIRNAIGLTVQQEQAVWGYRRLLETGAREALDRALRDRRFDTTVRDALDRARPLTSRQIDVMVARYRMRALALRADTISRTEALRAYSEAREEALEQMVEQAQLEQDRVERIWNRVNDERVRDWHDTMQRQVRRMGEAFVDGKGNRLRYPGDPDAPAETIISCRCTLTFRIKPAT